MAETKTIRVSVQFEDTELTHGEREEEAARTAFAQHPDALYACDPKYYSRIENRDGEPLAVSIVSLNVTVPSSNEATERA